MLRRSRPAALAAGLLAAGLVTAGLASAPAGADPAPSARGAAGPLYRDAHASVRRRVDDLLSRMTLAEKVGQMTQAERADIDADPSLIATYGLGSVLSGGGSAPTPNTPTAWADMIDRYQRAALTSRLGIPLLYGIDAVHGNNNVLGATIFPHNIGLGATRDPRLVERIAHVTAEETRSTGPQWAFAPCLCVARDDRWGRTYESFGEDPRLAEEMSVAIRGLQGRRGQLDDADRVLASAKHFAGDGLTTYGTGEGDYTVDQGIDEVSRRDFARLALRPFVDAVERYDVGTVMPSYSSVDWTDDGLGNPTKMHASKELLTGVLKQKMGFDGFVISDWRAIHQIPGTYRDQVRTSVNAGVDMFMEPYSGNADGWRDLVSTLTSLVEDGEVSRARIDDAVGRILTKKFELGLFEHPYTNRRHLEDVGSASHRAVAREAVARTQVLLRNRADTLPLASRGKRPLYLAGSNVDDLGNQAGGWTVQWQGGTGDTIPGDTIADGIRKATGRPVTVSTDASRPVPASADAVVVVGETPYAEGFGDVGGPRWNDAGVERPAKTMELSAADQQAIRTTCDAAASCTVLVVSGRPMIIPPTLLPRIDALVASWLPGSEGRGVADVLLGAKPFTGRLPVTWPRSVAQEPINVGDADYDPLYRYGFGLRTRAGSGHGGHHH